jgi:hypothetical protein
MALSGENMRARWCGRAASPSGMKRCRALNQRAKTLDLGNDGNACLNAIEECKAEEIDVVFYTRGGQNGHPQISH